MKFKKISSLALIPLITASSFAISQEGKDAKIEEVLVTGSYLKSSPKDGASPIVIVDRDNIDQMGAMSISDITRNLTANSGAENVPDSFTSGATQGTSNVNLRGLGLGSTLVLVNGRRNTLAAASANDGSSFVDTSMIPAIAVERVEVLKEGAASVYGSDAVAGVVNYITRSDFEGTEFGVFQQSTTSDSQTDTQLSFLHGWAGNDTKIVIAAQYMDRSNLNGADRPQLIENANSGLGNSFLILSPNNADTGFASQVDSGAYAGNYTQYQNIPDANCVETGGIILPQGSGERCGFKYGPRFNVVNEEERTHLFTNINHTLSNGMEFNTEAMWAKVEVLDNPQSPSYPALSYLTRPIMPNEAGNPFGAVILWLGRPLGSAFPSPLATRDNEHFRVALELDGDMGDYHFNTALTHSAYDGYGIQPDTSTSRFEAAVTGTGGPSGDQAWNLFDPSANSQELIDHISVEQQTATSTALTVFDFVIDGELGGFNFASGIQVRNESLEVDRNDISRVEFDASGNLTKPADLLFLGGGVNVDESKSAWAVFSEFQRDLTDSLEIGFAGRYENLDSGSTFDPKISARFEVSDNLILRASASTSYREASLHQLHASQVGLQGIQDFNTDGTAKGGTVFIRIAQNANVDLKAEEADNINIGAVWTPNDNLQVTMDYWSVDYTNVITIESAQGKVVADPNHSDVKRTTSGQLIGVTTNYFNAASVSTDGLDLEVNYNFPESSIGDLSLTFDASHFLSYEIPLGGQTTDVLGLFNHDNFARSLPKTKANTSLRWETGAHQASVTARYISGYETTRAGPPEGYSSDIDSHLTWDAQYNYQLALSSVDTQITIGVLNVTDEEPPLVWDSANYSYDSRQHDARGRMAYVRLKFAF
ncbi:MAG: TonB-dependent receptor [Porticoccaceae bacterium]|nr:TonB-dependent receptor [Porticoccaceae bacterium]